MLAQSGILDVKFKVKGYLRPARLHYEGGQIIVRFPFDRSLIQIIKNMDGARWNPDGKYWTIKNSYRNDFRIRHYLGMNPYKQYDTSLDDLEYTSLYNRPLKDHQYEMIKHAITRPSCIIGGEMGTGKTLASIESVEWFHNNIRKLDKGDVWYIGPVSGVRAVARELVKWDHKIPWEMYTYNKFTTVVRNWPAGKSAPRIIIYDESSKIKNPTSQRSQAALHVAQSSRDEHGEESMQILMSGSPAPRVPTDWWHQTEVACPGFLTEPNINKLKYRLAVIENRESLTGGVYPHLVTWLDDSSKCAECGEYEQNHAGKDHPFKKSRDEISHLKKRMDGLVIRIFKKDCTDLPDKIYDIIAVKPTVEMLRTAKSLKDTAPRALTAMGWLRELSDGFIYKHVKNMDKKVTCPQCHGTCVSQVPVEIDEYSMESHGFYEEDDETGMPDPAITIPQDGQKVKMEEVECPKCQGTGEVYATERIAEELGTPKDKLTADLLDEYEDAGRVIIWSGFQGSIDRLVKLCHKEGWATLRIDGRGYKGLDKDGKYIDENELLDAMDLSNPKFKMLNERHPKLAVIGHPQAGGMALTFTAAPVAIYYSNSFDGEARPQSEDRAHRLGMDVNRGLRIIDIICLPSDLLVLKNLKEKKRLQSLTMGDLNDSWSNAEAEITKYID